MIQIKKVRFKDSEFKDLRQIRYTVFVEEQKVSEADEFDEYEASCEHFLAFLHEKPVGAARWRKTDKGFKLERFAVLEEARGKGVGQALVKAVLEAIPAKARDLLYLHAQVDAVPLYAKFGFEKKGELFEECKIWHYRMEKVI